MIELIGTEDLMNELLKRNPHTVIIINVTNEMGQHTITKFNGQFHVGLGLLEMGKLVIQSMMAQATPPPTNPLGT